MRRLLATVGITAMGMLIAGCGGYERGVDDATAEACANAEATRSTQIEWFYDRVATLDEAALSEEEYELAALGHLEEAVLAWSADLDMQATEVGNPELSVALTDLSQGLTTAATDLSEADPESVPDLHQLEPLSAALAEICYPNGPPPEQAQ